MLTFDVKAFSVEVVRLYLDILHGIKLYRIQPNELMEMLRFLIHDNKIGEAILSQSISIINKSFLDSPFEKDLFNSILIKVDSQNLTLDTKVLIWLLYGELEAEFYDEEFVKVKIVFFNLKRNLFCV